MEKLSFSIFGISSKRVISDWKEKFSMSDWSRDEVTYFESNKTFSHTEEDFSFKYKYVIEFLEHFDSNNNKEDYLVILQMVILPESLTKINLEKVARFCEIEEEEVNCYDLLDYGSFSVDFGVTTCEIGEIEETVIRISNVFEMMDSLRGFFLDKRWNLIGTNGWDIVLHAVKDEELFKMPVAK